MRGGGPNREFGVQIWVIFLLKSARIKAGILEQGVLVNFFSWSEKFVWRHNYDLSPIFPYFLNSSDFLFLEFESS